MKYLAIVIFSFLKLTAYAQTPANDGNWQLYWSDEFNYTGKPNPAVWKYAYPWGHFDYGTNNHTVFMMEDGSNLSVQNGFLT